MNKSIYRTMKGSQSGENVMGVITGWADDNIGCKGGLYHNWRKENMQQEKEVCVSILGVGEVCLCMCGGVSPSAPSFILSIY